MDSQQDQVVKSAEFTSKMKSPSHRKTAGRRTIPISILMVLIGVLGIHSSIRCQDKDEIVDEAVTLFNQGQDAHEKRDYPAAVEFYNKALKLLPEFPEAELQRATALTALGDLSGAEDSFRRAVGLRSDWSLALSGLGSVLIAEKKFDEAELVLGKAIMLDQQNFPAYTAMADLYLKTGAAPEARTQLLSKMKSLTSKANPNASLLAAQGAIESSLGDLAGSKLSLSRVLEIEPDNLNALFQLAWIALRENDAKRAEHFAFLISKLDQKSADSKLLSARILFAQGKTAEALQDLDSIQPPTKESADLKNEIAALSSTNAVEVEKALLSKPDDPTILGRLCMLYRTDDPAKAMDYCRRASIADPQNIQHAIGYGAALVQAKRYDEAIVLLRGLLKSAPENSTLHANLATALFQLKRFPEAKDEFEWLRERQPELPIPYYFLGIAYDQLQRYPDAMANYQAFLKLADSEKQKVEIEKVTLRLPSLEKLIKERKGKR